MARHQVMPVLVLTLMMAAVCLGSSKCPPSASVDPTDEDRCVCPAGTACNSETLQQAACLENVDGQSIFEPANCADCECQAGGSLRSVVWESL